MTYIDSYAHGKPFASPSSVRIEKEPSGRCLAVLLCVLRRDEPSDEFSLDEHYTFVESLPQTEKRNPRVYDGRYITATRREDGNLRLNFR